MPGPFEPVSGKREKEAAINEGGVGEMSAAWVGIDVSKHRLDMAVRPSGEVLSVDNDDAGIRKLIKLMRKLAPQRSTNTLSPTPLRADFAVAIVNPCQVRHFARAVGRLAKTDPIDAKILAHFAEAVQPPPRPVPDPDLEEIGQLVTRHRQLIEMIVAE